ncbi:MAG: CCA tRNA nucleotidyltransferase [Candidatus Omnitrophica bacterium]|nr:CCA tRNA nucleotidyltransferase [Candidatus Omnitrophota bacterium]
MDLSQHLGQTAFEIAKTLKAKGHTAYFAGGCVRDFLMGETPKDYDIATTASPGEIERLFPKTLAVGKQFGVILVVQEGKNFEVATFRREGAYHDGRHPSEVSFTDPEEDAKRRDFTVNGLFYDPFAKRVIDYVGGEEDISRRIIRSIGNPETRFEEDKLRLLRAVRFAANLNFTIEPKTWETVRHLTPKIHQVSAERIRDELIKTFTRSGAGRGLELLSSSGLLKEVLPEIEAMKGVEQPPEFHPEGDVFIHTRMLMERLQDATPVLAFAALLHDVGKPPTFQIREGRIRFYEHARVGAQMAKNILRRLRFSNDEIEAVAACVDNHMKFANVKEMREGKLKRFMGTNTFPTELELHRIDCESSHGLLDNYRFLIKKTEEFKKLELKPKPLLDGNDLIALGMKPGPSMKPILEEAYELQLENRIQTKEKARSWAKGKMDRK